MIVTVSDESSYLIETTKYMIISLANCMPEERLFVVIVNGKGIYDNEIRNWHPRAEILHYSFNAEQKNKTYFIFMSLPLFDLLSSYDEPLIYLDGDIIIKESFDKLLTSLKTNDSIIMVRYRPYIDFKGPLGTVYGAKVNSGVLALSNTPLIRKFVKDFKNRITEYITSDINPISWNSEKTVLTGIDQELLWLMIMEYNDKIKFIPLDDKYNDSYFIGNSKIWHAKGVTRTYPEYLIECHKYGRKDVNIVKEYYRLYYRKFKRLVKKFINKPIESFEIKELVDILKSVDIKNIIIVNSDFYLDNEKLLENKNIECYDSDPVIYYKNKGLLKNKGIFHKFIVYDAEQIEKQQVDLLFCEEKNLKITSLIDYETKIIKE